MSSDAVKARKGAEKRLIEVLPNLIRSFDHDELQKCHSGRFQDLLSRSWPKRFSYDFTAARLPNVLAHVSQPYSDPSGPLPCGRTGFARLRLLGCTRSQTV